MSLAMLPLAALAQVEPPAAEDALAPSGVEATGQPSPADDAPQEIVVTATPIRDSLAASIEAQREAINVINVTTSDTIGRFPDATAAAALARLPAVAVQRDQGQERFIQVRGAPTHWTQVSFDGINVLGAQDRIFRFDSVPAALIDTLELSKTLTPDMPSEALAGRVNIKTFSALSQRGWDTQLDAGYGWIDLADGPQETYSGRVAWSDGRFGAVLAGSHFEFEQQADNAEPRYDTTGLSEVRTVKYITDRETNAWSGKFEWQAAPEHAFRLTSLYSEFKDDERRTQYTFGFARAAMGGTRGFATGDLQRVPVDGVFEEGDLENNTLYNALAGDHDFGTWNAGWTLAYTETEDFTDLPLVLQRASNPELRPSVRYEAGDTNFPRFTLANDRLDQRAFDSENLLYFGERSDTEAWTLKTDASREWQVFGTPSTLSLGLQFDRREADGTGPSALLRPDGTAGSLNLRDTAMRLGVAWTPFEFITGDRIDESFRRGYAWNYIDNRGLRDHLDEVLDAARAANADGSGSFALPTRDPGQRYRVDEDISAIYAMNRWQWGESELLAGARIERVEVRSRGVVSRPGAAMMPPTREPISVDRRFTDVFPSVHWSYDLTDTLKYRLSGVSGSARPTYKELRGTAALNDVLRSVTGGNPELEPETAYGLDTSLEWYFARASLLAANAFWRDVDKVLFDATTTVGDNRFDFDGLDRSEYVFQTTLNGDSGELYGLELSYIQPWTFLPPVLSGLGLQASIAFLEGNFETDDGREADFPGTSDRVTNLALFYEKFNLSVRLGWQHRTDWLDEVSGDPTTDLYWDASERLDLSVRYQLSRALTLYVDANNLTDELGVRYRGEESRPFEVERFGRRYLFGLRAHL